MTASVSISGLEDLLAEIAARLAAIEEKLDRTQEVGWYDVAAAAAYLSQTPAAIRKAEATGKIEATRSRTGRVLFSRSALDAFANGG